MKDKENCIVISSKTKLIFPNLPANEDIEFLTEMELSVNTQDINGEKVKESFDALVNIEEYTSGLNISFTLYQLQCITAQAAKLVSDSMRNYTD